MSAVAEAVHSAIWEPTRFQHVLLSTHPAVNVACTTGRGPGKSTGFALLMLRGSEMLGAHYRSLYLRMTYKGLSDFEQVLLEIFTEAYGPTGFKHRRDEHTFQLPTGAFIELGELSEGAKSYAKYQGRSFVEIFIDEAQQFADPKYIDLLQSNLRSAHAPTRMLVAANPLGPGSGWIRHRFINQAPPGVEFQYGGRPWVRLSGTYIDNQHLDHAEYANNLRAATVGDPARRQAWLEGRFDVDDAGALLADCFTSKNVIRTDPRSLPFAHMHEYSLSHDWGFAAPAVTLLTAETIDSHTIFGQYVPRGSILVLDEHTSAKPGSISEGRRLAIPDLAEEIHEWLREWPYARPKGVADDAITAARGDQEVTFAEEFKRCGIHLRPARKGQRVASIQRLIRYLAAANLQDDQPRLLINGPRCPYLMKTLPMIQRSDRNPEDTTNCDFDHGFDALRYRLSPSNKDRGYCHVQRFHI